MCHKVLFKNTKKKMSFSPLLFYFYCAIRKCYFLIFIKKCCAIPKTKMYICDLLFFCRVFLFHRINYFNFIFFVKIIGSDHKTKEEDTPRRNRRGTRFCSFFLCYVYRSSLFFYLIFYFFLCVCFSYLFSFEKMCIHVIK